MSSSSRELHGSQTPPDLFGPPQRLPNGSGIRPISLDRAELKLRWLPMTCRPGLRARPRMTRSPQQLYGLCLAAKRKLLYPAALASPVFAGNQLNKSLTLRRHACAAQIAFRRCAIPRDTGGIVTGLFNYQTECNTNAIFTFDFIALFNRLDSQNLMALNS